MKKKHTGTLVTGIFLVVLTLILIFVNVIVAQLPPMRLDLTGNRQYSLSDATKNVLKRLEDRVKVQAYFTKDLPAPYNQSAGYVRDLLEEYATYAGGNLDYEFIDPGADEAKKREVARKGIPPVQIQEIKNDQIGIKQAFMGIVVTYGTKREVIPLVRQTENLEFELTSMIKRLSSQQLKTVAFSAGHGEPALDDKMKQVKAALEKNYRVITHDFSTTKEIAADVNTLVVVGPQEKWSDEDTFYLDQFMMRGGTIAFLLDGVKVDLRQLSNAEPIDHGLFDILTSYGVKPEKNLIVDPQCQRITLEGRQGNIQVRNLVNYPYIPLLTDLNRSQMLTKELGALSLPFMSSMTVVSNKPGVVGTVLARTSARSWEEKGDYSVNPLEHKIRPQDAASGPFNGVVTATGKFTSFFANKSKEEGDDTLKDPSKVLKESLETRILVVGSGFLPLDGIANRDDLVFFVNAVDWLVQDPEMINIRNRGLSDRPIADLTPAARTALRYVNVIGVPLVFILFGIGRWQWRKAKLRNFKL
jgi:gliding-associated putative ABC transporter substrate-binding component GldG